MKCKFIMIAACSAFATISSAQIWQNAKPVTSPLVLGDTVYLYNVKADKFFSEGNNYNTQTVVSPDGGLKVCFTKHLDQDGIWDNKTVVFNDSSCTAGSWRKVFIDGKSLSYVDYTGNFFWEIETMGTGNNFRIHTSEKNENFSYSDYEGCYLGLDVSREESNIALNPLLELNNDQDGDKYLCDWAVVLSHDYEAWMLHNRTVVAAQALASLIEEAKQLGINTAEAEDVYNNTESNIEQIDAAIANLRKMITEVVEEGVTPQSPKDMTSFITNPDYDNNDNTGWSGATVPGFDKKNNTQNAESYNSNTIDVYQTLTNMPNGVYKLEVQGFYRAGLANSAYEAWQEGKRIKQNVYLFATSGERKDSVLLKSIIADMQSTSLCNSESVLENGFFVPDNMLAASAYFSAGLYNNELCFYVENGEMSIGLQKNVRIDRDWTIWDNWQLNYYGNSTESFKYWMNSVFAKSENFLEETYVYSNALRQEFNNIISSADDKQTKEEIVEKIGRLEALIGEIEQSIKAYSAYLAKCEEAEEVVGSISGTGCDILGDYLMEPGYADFTGYMELYLSGYLSTEEIINETAKVAELIANAYATSIEEGADVTYIIANPNFNNGITGWSYDSSLGTPGKGGLATNPNCEVYNANFDVYQEFTSLPKGVYRLDVQAFFRSMANEGAWAGRETDEVKSFIYANNIQATVKNIMSEAQDEVFENAGYYTTPEGTYVPNNMNNASESFSTGKYENTVYGVVTDGTLRIGIRQTDGSISGRWTIFDNFRLTYVGYDAEELRKAIAPVVNEITVFLQENKMGCDTRENLQNVIDRYKNETDGKALAQLLTNIQSLVEEGKNSVAIYKSLEEALLKLSENMELYQETASASALTAAMELADNMELALYNSSATTAEAQEMIIKTDELIVRLKLTEEIATDENPIDLTHIIENPSFDNDDMTGWKGTTAGFNTADATGVAELYNQANFDFYQILTGLNNGMYKVGVTGFYRAGKPDNAYTLYTSENPSENLHVFLYAKSGENQASVQLSSICEGMSENKIDIGSNRESMVGNTYYVPNDMVSAAAYLTASRYTPTEVYIKVTDGTLRLGLQKNRHISADWTLFDNFTLTYYGDDSNKQPTDNAVGISTTEKDMETTIVGIYTLEGVRIQNLQKGINIVKMSDGAVKKVLIK